MTDESTPQDDATAAAKAEIMAALDGSTLAAVEAEQAEAEAEEGDEG